MNFFYNNYYAHNIRDNTTIPSSPTDWLLSVSFKVNRVLNLITLAFNATNVTIKKFE